jgi:hypothetical protein
MLCRDVLARIVGISSEEGNADSAEVSSGVFSDPYARRTGRVNFPLVSDLLLKPHTVAESGGYFGHWVKMGS